MHLTDAYGIYPGECIFAGIVTEYLELCFSIEEADSRIIPQIKRVVFMSNNTNFVTYSLEYHQRFCELGKDGWKNITFKSWVTNWRREVFSFAESLHSDWM